MTWIVQLWTYVQLEVHEALAMFMQGTITQSVE